MISDIVVGSRRFLKGFYDAKSVKVPNILKAQYKYSILLLSFV